MPCLPHTCLASGWGNELADEFSSEMRLKVPRAATLVSGPTAAWGTAGFKDREKATLRREHATDDRELILQSSSKQRRHVFSIGAVHKVRHARGGRGSEKV